MKHTIPISVFIIAQNEADRIPLAIRSVIDWVDEVIVIDSGSSDNTVELSRDLGANVVFNEWQGYGPQKSYGETLCSNDWLLNIDADEEISENLRDEIIDLFQNEQLPCDAYRLPIMPIDSIDSANPSRSTNKNIVRHKPVRLYRKSVCQFKTAVVHDSVIVPSNVKVGKLRGVVHHRSFRSLSHHVEKANFYSTAQAEVLFQSKRKTNFAVMFILPFLAFWKSYLLRREFLNGIDGVSASHMFAFQRFIRYAKLRELERMKNADR